MMNRWLRRLMLLGALTAASSPTFAACEAEIETATNAAVSINSSISRQQLNASWIKRRADLMIMDPPTRTFMIDSLKRELYGAARTRLSNFDLQVKPADLCLANLAASSGPKQNSSQSSDSQQRPDQSQQSSQQNQSAQQQSQQAQQQAQQNQARADQARQGKRKTHDAAAEAHQCIAIDNAGSGNFGAFKNTCSYKVNFDTCNYKPRITQGGFNWSADFDCEKQQIGMHTPGAGVSVAAHNRNTEMVYWFACKAPATPVDVTYVQGQGLSGRCN